MVNYNKQKKQPTPESCEKKAVKDYLDALGFFHFPNVAGFAAYPGVPDRTAIKNGVVVQIEVKKPTGGVQSVKQKEFQADWESKGGYYICGNSSQIIEFLQNLAKNKAQN